MTPEPLPSVGTGLKKKSLPILVVVMLTTPAENQLKNTDGILLTTGESRSSMSFWRKNEKETSYQQQEKFSYLSLSHFSPSEKYNECSFKNDCFQMSAINPAIAGRSAISKSLVITGY